MNGFHRGSTADRRPRVFSGAALAIPMVGAMLLAAACQSPGPTPSNSGSAGASAVAVPIDRAALAAALSACTADTGYDPAAALDMLGETELGADELEWRDCAYAALNAEVRPKLLEPEALDALIEDDRQLTQAIAAGSSTRSARLDRLTLRVDAIKEQEQQVRASVAAATGDAQVLTDLQAAAEFAQMRADIDMISTSFR